MTRRTLQALVAAIFISSMFIFSLAVSHAEEKTTDDTRGAYLLSYAVKGSFGTVSNITVAGLASQEECNRVGAERSGVDQRHHPFPPKFVPMQQYSCEPITVWHFEDEETTGDIKTPK